MKRLGLWGALAGLGVLGAWFLFLGRGGEKHPAPGPVGERTGGGTAPDPLGGVVTGDVGSEGIGTPISEHETQVNGTRTPAAGSGIAGWVVDRRGDPIGGARVELVGLTRTDREWEPAWREGEWGPLDSPRRATSTDARGRFSFSEWIGEGEGGEYVLFASRVGSRTNLEHAIYPSPGARNHRLVLEDEPGVEVLVVSPGGDPVPGAAVRRFSTVPKEEARGGGPLEQGWRRWAVAEGVTGLDGLVLLPAIPGEEVLVAESGDQVSLPWKGVPRGRVVLELTESFLVEGTVELEDWSELGYEGERRIRVVMTRGGIERDLAILRHVEQGPWGPVRVARVPEASYRVELEGSPIVPDREPIEVPAPGGVVSVRLEGKVGAHQWVLLVDGDEHPIPDGWATFDWELDGKVNHVTRRAGEDGYINMWSVPDVSFRVTAGAPGFATVEFPGHRVFEDGRALQLSLPRSGVVRGRCMRSGVPVRNFTVVAQSEGSSTWTKEQFEGRDDGSFELTTVALGQNWILASSADSPPCDPVPVRVVDGETQTVILELREGTACEGVVVDALTLQPIAGARLRRAVSAQLNVAEWWGADAFTKDDGHFILPRVGSSGAVVEVSAPGYSKTTVRVSPEKASGSEPLRIALPRPGSVEVALDGLKDGAYSEFECLLTGQHGAALDTTFDGAGIARFDGVSPGTVRVEITRPPDRLFIRGLDLAVHAGSHATAHLRVAGGNHLTVEFEDGGATSDPFLWCVVRYRLPGGEEAFILADLGEDRVCEIAGIESATVWAGILSGTGQVFGAARGTFRDGSLSLHIRSDAAPFLLTVTDSAGAPLAGVEVSILDPLVGGRIKAGKTDAKGEMQLFALPEAPVSVLLQHPTHGTSLSGSIDGRLDHGTLVLEADRSLEIVVVHDGIPLGAVSGSIRLSGELLRGSTRTSGVDGVLAWDRLAEGTYSVELRRTGFWTESLQVAATANKATHTAELRALGSLVVRILSSEGVPAPGIELTVLDRTSGTDANTWLEQGLVRWSGATNTNGETHFQGLPEGEYLVRTKGPGGAELGVARVERGKESVVAFGLGG